MTELQPPAPLSQRLTLLADYLADSAGTLPIPDDCDIPKLLRDAATALSDTAPSWNAALEALAAIKWDIENCDWSCDQCRHDPGMEETDIALTIKGFEERHGTLPPAYSVAPTDDGKKGKR